MTTLVVDASMALAWIYERENLNEAACADRALEALTEISALVPPLFYVEVANALLVGERRKVITEAQSIDFFNKLKQLGIKVDDVGPTDRLDQAMALAREHSLSAYDATYFELALRMDAVLATFDDALARAMKRAGGKLFGRE